MSNRQTQVPAGPSAGDPLDREYGCTLQTGGQDQWGNLTAGTDLIRRVTGESVHLLATPLITDSHGQKFGKSEGNAVWLSPELTSPYAFYQYWLNVEDASVGALLKVFTDRTAEEIEELERAVRERPQAREAQRTLALDVTSLGARGRCGCSRDRGQRCAVRTWRARRSGCADTARGALRGGAAPRWGGELPSVVGLLVAGGLARSLSEARRAVAEGGANINNVRISDPDHVPQPADLLHGRYLVLRRGKKSVAGVEVGAPRGGRVTHLSRSLEELM